MFLLTGLLKSLCAAAGFLAPFSAASLLVPFSAAGLLVSFARHCQCIAEQHYISDAHICQIRSGADIGSGVPELNAPAAGISIIGVPESGPSGGHFGNRRPGVRPRRWAFR